MDSDVVEWIQERYVQNIDGTSRSLAQSLMGEPSGANAEAALQAASSLKRDAEIAFTRARIRAIGPARIETPVGGETREVFVRTQVRTAKPSHARSPKNYKNPAVQCGSPRMNSRSATVCCRKSVEDYRRG